MTIKEVEEKTGLARSNIRFYEKENLISPDRNEKNGYREYTEENVNDIKKIAYLRTLGISVQNIQKIMSYEIGLMDAICEQEKILDDEILELNRAKTICRQMIADGEMNYDTLDIERYTERLPEYWRENKKVFKLDSVSFLCMWGGTLVWGAITLISLLVGILTYPYLPDQIPVQYSAGEASSTIPKLCIFFYPVACMIIRMFFRAYFRWKFGIQHRINDLISDYMTNCLCFVALSAEIFSVLFVYGYVKNVVIMLFVDAIVLGGALICGVSKLASRPEQEEKNRKNI
ncbi:MAG: MerR family transcriptional regulator [Eubacteriales bacterium]|nr:MerR family transcriptional regulator [Eubacteriales bacterium]